MNKKNSKPILDPQKINEYPSLQTIVYHEKHINAIYCPLLREVKKRLLALLGPRFHVFTDISPEEFAKRLSKACPPEIVTGLTALEVDISKYDKSQGSLTLLLECKLYSLLGLADYWVYLWWFSHQQTTVRDRETGVTAYIDYQRKSGDASTFLGNTIVLMSVLCYVYDMKSVRLGMFAGDDSLFLTEESNLEDRSQELATNFNLEAKLLKYDNHYFCSKFLIDLGEVWAFIPDPLKIVAKLGRRDMVNDEHVHEYFVCCTKEQMVREFPSSPKGHVYGFIDSTEVLWNNHSETHHFDSCSGVGILLYGSRGDREKQK